MTAPFMSIAAATAIALKDNFLRLIITGSFCLQNQTFGETCFDVNTASSIKKRGAAASTTCRRVWKARRRPDAYFWSCESDRSTSCSSTRCFTFFSANNFRSLKVVIGVLGHLRLNSATLRASVQSSCCRRESRLVRKATWP